MVFVFPCLTYFTQRDTFQVHSSVCKWQDFMFSYMCVCVCVCQSLSHVQLFATLWTIAHQATLSLGFSRQEYQTEYSLLSLLQGIFPTQGLNPALLHYRQILYPFIYWWAFRLLPYLAYCKQYCKEQSYTYLFKVVVLFSLDKYSEVELLNHVVAMFLDFFLRNLHIIFHSGCTNLHFLQQCRRIPSSLCPLQHLLLLHFLIIAIWTQFYTQKILKMLPANYQSSSLNLVKLQNIK